MTSMTPFISQDRIVKPNYFLMENLAFQGHIKLHPFKSRYWAFALHNPHYLKLFAWDHNKLRILLSVIPWHLNTMLPQTDSFPK